ncbi:hypothetical protein WH158_13500 [Gluconobacter cerinus]|uniref:hypothetical protein n=1 Tax=Gluconobacter cerinus TaxID=38307 RepID=UPI0030A1CEAE
MESIYKYLGEIRSTMSNFENFVFYFDSPDITIWKSGHDPSSQVYNFASKHLNDCEDHQSALNRLISLKTLFDGAMLIFFDENYLCHEVRITNYNGNSIYIDQSNVDITVDPFSENYIQEYVPEDIYCDLGDARVPRTIFLSRYDKVTKDILKYIGYQKISYITLYAINDWLLKNGWDKSRILKETGWSNSTLKRFTYTANTPECLGPYCRHGGTYKAETPPVPLSLHEATQPMLLALRAFLNERFLTKNIGGIVKGYIHPPIDTTK